MGSWKPGGWDRAALGAESTVMAPGQCRKTGVRGKLSKKDQMEDRSG